MRALVIGSSAGPTLPDQPDELAGIVRDLPGAVPLWGDVRERDILEAIQNRGPFDGLIISAHGDTDGRIALADGALSANALAAYANRAAAKWIILAACYSGEIVGVLLMATAADVLAASREIEDRDAWRITRTVAQELSRTEGDIRAAIEQLTPAAIEPLRFYANTKRRHAEAPGHGHYETMEINTHQPTLSRDRIEDALDAIRRELATLSGKVTLLEYQMQQQNARTGAAGTQTAWIIVVATLLVAAAVFSLLVAYMLRAGA